MMTSAKIVLGVDNGTTKREKAKGKKATEKYQNRIKKPVHK